MVKHATACMWLVVQKYTRRTNMFCSTFHYTEHTAHRHTHTNPSELVVNTHEYEWSLELWFCWLSSGHKTILLTLYDKWVTLYINSVPLLCGVFFSTLGMQDGEEGAGSVSKPAKTRERPILVKEKTKNATRLKSNLQCVGRENMPKKQRTNTTTQKKRLKHQQTHEKNGKKYRKHHIQG